MLNEDTIKTYGYDYSFENLKRRSEIKDIKPVPTGYTTSGGGKVFSNSTFIVDWQMTESEYKKKSPLVKKKSPPVR